MCVDDYFLWFKNEASYKTYLEKVPMKVNSCNFYSNSFKSQDFVLAELNSCWCPWVLYQQCPPESLCVAFLWTELCMAADSVERA